MTGEIYGFPSTEENVALLGDDGFIYRTDNFQTTPPTWTQHDPGMTDIQYYSWVVDPFSPGYRYTGSEINGWVVGKTAIWRITDIFGTPAASSVHTFAFDDDDITHGSGKIHFSRTINASYGDYQPTETDNPWLMVVSYYEDATSHPGTWAIYSQDAGVTWSSEVQISAHYDSGLYSGSLTRQRQIGLHLSPKTPGLAYTAAYSSTANPPTADGYVTTDWGATWAAMTDPDVQPGNGLAGSIHAPWPTNDNEDLVFHGHLTVANPILYRVKRVTSTTIEDVSPTDTGIVYGVNHRGFGVRTYDSDRNFVAMGAVGNETTASEDDDYHTVFVSDDGGDTWTLVLPPLNDGFFYGYRGYEVAFSGDDPSTLFIWGATPGEVGCISYTSDFGVTVLDKTGNIFADFYDIDGAPTGFLGICSATNSIPNLLPRDTSSGTTGSSGMFWIDISDANGNKLGPGPLTTGIKWRYTQRLSRAGEWSLEVPATDPRLEFATLKRNFTCYTMITGTKTWLGGGALEKRVMSLHGTDAPTMVLSGNDILYELARTTLNFKLDSTSPFLGEGIYTKILENAPGWIYNVDAGTPNMTVEFVEESILNALTTVTNKTGQMFRLSQPLYFLGTLETRFLRIFSNITPSNVVATNMADAVAIERNKNACMIVDIDRQEDVTGLINEAHPYGAGTGHARLTIAAATLWPDGTPSGAQYQVTDAVGRVHNFVCDQVNNWVVDTPSYLKYGRYIGQVQFKEIGPVTNSSTDFAAAANALLAATVQFLMNSSLPQEHYTLNIAGLRRQVFPGESIRVQARQMRDGRTPINIDQDLIIQEVTTEVDANSARVVSLTVATTREFASSDVQILANEIKKSLAYQAHPQMGPTDPVICYREDIDGIHGATFPFWISNATTQINSVVMRFKLEQLRSTVKTIGGSASGSVSIPNHTHGVTLPSHTHGVSISNHTHDVPDHQHNMAFEPGSGGAVVEIFSGGGSPDFGSIVANGIPHTIYVNTNADSGATTSASDGGATVTSAGGGGTTVTSAGGGGQSGLTVDISSALSAQYGIYEDPNAAYVIGDLQWAVNSLIIGATPTSIGFGWYEFDITPYLIDTLTGRPLQPANTVSVSVKPANVVADRNVRITAQIEIRKIIQSIAVIAGTAASTTVATADPFASPRSPSVINADLLEGFPPEAFVLATDYDPGDILAKIVTVDGSGSGLDAEFLQGYEPSDFALTIHTHPSTDITDLAEAAQDVVGAMLVDSSTIDFTYNDAGGTESASVIDTSITFAKMQTLATDRLIGRDTAGTGAPESIALGASLEFGGSGTIQRAALTGDVTASANSNATTIAANAVTNAKLATMAQSTIKGRASGAGTGAPVDLTANQLSAVLAEATVALTAIGGIVSNPTSTSTIGVFVTLPTNSSSAGLLINSLDNGANGGPSAEIRQNTNVTTPAAGFLRIYGKNGNANDIWPDSSATPGILRIGNATATATDLAGSIVGSQVSWIKYKENIEELTDREELLRSVLETKLYNYQMIGDGERNFDNSKPTYHGLIITEDDRKNNAWFASNLGDEQIPSLNEKNLFGYLIASIQALHSEINDLRAEIKALKS